MTEVFSVNKNEGEIEIIDEITFSDIGWSEPREIEEIAVNNLSILTRQGKDNDSLLLIGRQVVDTTRGQNDLVALDSDGNLVLIELKRDEKDVRSRKENIELQAIRYASALARIGDVDKLIDRIYIPYIAKYTDVEEPSKYARNKIYDFINSNNINTENLNRKQRIIIFANGYDKRSLSSLAWLSDNGIDITVLRGNLYKKDDEILMSIEQLIPSIPEQEYYIDIDDSRISRMDKSDSITEVIDINMSELLEYGVIEKGDKLKVKGEEDTTAKLLDKSYVEYNGEKIRTNDWAQEAKNYSSINIYDHVKHVGKDKLLKELRRELFDKIDKGKP